jgi:hypothetical protein
MQCPKMFVMQTQHACWFCVKDFHEGIIGNGMEKDDSQSR